MSSEKKPRKEKPKFYAVRKGRFPGIYNKWEEAEKQVNDGFKKPEHKSFSTKKEAENYMKGDDTNKKTIRFVKLETQLEILYDQCEEQKKHIIALTDNYISLRYLIANHFLVPAAPVSVPISIHDNNNINNNNDIDNNKNNINNNNNNMMLF